VLLASVGTGSFFLAREVTGDEPEAGPDLGPFWYSQALEEDSKKPRIAEQTLNGIVIGPDVSPPAIDLCEKDPGGARPIPAELVDARSEGTPVEISPSYVPDAVSLGLAEARECAGTIVNVVKSYVVEAIKDARTQEILRSGGGFFIARTLTSEPQYPTYGAAERLRAVTIGGHPAVLVEPVKPRGRDIGLAEIVIVVDDGDAMTVIQGSGLPQDDFVRLAEGLY
jgi:hypothetical protein